MLIYNQITIDFFHDYSFKLRAYSTSLVPYGCFNHLANLVRGSTTTIVLKLQRTMLAGITSTSPVAVSVIRSSIIHIQRMWLSIIPAKILLWGEGVSYSFTTPDSRFSVVSHSVLCCLVLSSPLQSVPLPHMG